MEEKGTAHHGTKKQQRQRRADGQLAGSSPGVHAHGKASASQHLQGRVGSHVLIQGHAPPSMREMSYGYLLWSRSLTGGGGAQPGEWEIFH